MLLGQLGEGRERTVEKRGGRKRGKTGCERPEVPESVPSEGSSISHARGMCTLERQYTSTVPAARATASSVP